MTSIDQTPAYGSPEEIAAAADAKLAGIRPEVLAALPAAIERRLHAPKREPRDWQGHHPLPSFLYGKWDWVTAAALMPSDYLGLYNPVYNTCYPDCPRCVEMAAQPKPHAPS